MIEIPDTTRGKGIVFVSGSWYVCYWEDGKSRRALLRVSTEKQAIKARDVFYEALITNRKTTIRRRKKPIEKLKDKPDLFVYRRDPYYVMINGKIIATAKTRAEARRARDSHLQAQKP